MRNPLALRRTGRIEAGAPSAGFVRLERQLVRIRWFGVALGTYLIWAGNRDPAGVPVPGHVRPIGYALMGALLALNLLVLLAVRSGAPLRRIGLLTFAGDGAVLLALTWLYSFDHNDVTWVILYIAPLEGAARFRFRGALTPVLVAFPMALLQDAIGSAQYGFRFDVSNAVFRIGIMAIIACFAGVLAEQLAREREQAEDRAREMQAFQEIVLAGVAGTTLDETVGSIVEMMGRSLGYESFGLGLIEEARGGPIVRCVAAFGFSPEAVGMSVRFGEGVCGRAASTGEPQLVADTRLDPDYVEMMPGARSELVVPVCARGRVIGVLNAESVELAWFDAADRERLERLAPQIGLIISNARLLEQERATTDRLRELDQLKSDFVAITSHELRTPLTAISGFVKTLRRPDVERSWGDVDRGLAVVDRQADHLIRLVEDLLMAARIETGALRLDVKAVDLGELVREALRDLEKGAERVRVSAPAAGAEVRTDPRRLGQALRNLIENAVKFSPPPSPIDVRARIAGGDATIEVADSGPGIPPDELEGIFERFRQVGGQHDRRGSGVGLGLYITRTLVEALGGAVEVASRAGQGSTFRVRIPAGAPAMSSPRRPRSP